VFERAAQADWLSDDEAVLSLELDGIARAYPVRVMAWHEIVNDEVAGVPAAVTYCPSCNSAVAFERRLNGRTFDFGTSGALYLSALVMYHRQTETLWTHFGGRAVVGRRRARRSPHHDLARTRLTAQRVGTGVNVADVWDIRSIRCTRCGSPTDGPRPRNSGTRRAGILSIPRGGAAVDAARTTYPQCAVAPRGPTTCSGGARRPRRPRAPARIARTSSCRTEHSRGLFVRPETRLVRGLE
jgi:hypothetical protein